MIPTHFLDKMSEGTKKIYESTQWSKTGFIPSFKETDKKLMEISKKEAFIMLKEKYKETLELLSK